MAWAKGTATDFIDFLRKLGDYASGVIDPASDPDINEGEQVPLADRWEIQTNGALQPDLPVSGFATDGELYLIGPGSDPADQIVVGFKTYRNAGNNIFGWEIRGYTQFNDTLDFTSMPGTSPSCFAAFDDAAFDCYFWVNARRIMALAVVGTAPILVHAGFVQQFGTRSQWPYPLMVSGSQDGNDQNFQANHFGQSCLPDPCLLGCQLRWVDGSWVPIRHYTSDNSQRSQARETSGGFKIWPQRDATTTDGAVSETEGNEETLFEQFSTTGMQISSSEIDSYPLFPCIIHSATQLAARIDGLFVAGGIGLTTGDTITDSSTSPPKIYDVFSNTWRTETIDFFAILRE